ncbi:HAD-IA family hydrolase [Candidatus Nomurabacteria bacterium]|nr:HAD-IA family hydrolase [Candidatus Kaiserbacteria bacterium]MCB9814372.1 HAD-IA family hydrolase [Candidatus Nomurabacteria bacterium]
MKALLLDADGVVLGKGEYFSIHLARVQGVPEETVTEFFRKEYLLCQAGKADLKEVIEPYLEKWNWESGVEELLSYWFELDFTINETLSLQVKELRQKGVECFMASNNEQYRAEYIQKVLEEKDVLDGFFFSSRLGVSKSDPKFFEAVLQELNLPGEEVCFVDNEEKNLAAARAAGIESYLFSEDLLEALIKKV